MNAIALFFTKTLPRWLLIALLIAAGGAILLLLSPFILLVAAVEKTNEYRTRRIFRAIALRSRCPQCGSPFDLAGIHRGEKRFREEERAAENQRREDERRGNLFIFCGYVHYRHTSCSGCGAWARL